MEIGKDGWFESCRRSHLGRSVAMTERLFTSGTGWTAGVMGSQREVREIIPSFGAKARTCLRARFLVSRESQGFYLQRGRLLVGRVFQQCHADAYSQEPAIIDPWRITLFGGLRAQRGEQVTTRFRTQKTASLLAYLAYFLPRSHAREVLIELLWPEGSLESGRHNLSVALSSLRQQLEPAGIPDGGVLVTERFSVHLHPSAVTTDVSEFEEAMRSATGADSTEERVDWLIRAVEQYRGELLPGFYDDWISVEQHRLRARLLQALEQLVRDLEQGAHFERALSFALRAMNTDPLREESHRTVMRLYAAMSEPSAAMRHYDGLVSLLKQELDIVPSSATRALAREIACMVSSGTVTGQVNALHSRMETGSAEPPSPSTLDFEGGRSENKDVGVGRVTAQPVDPPTLPQSHTPSPDLEPVGGAVPLGSTFYVVRPADYEFEQAVERGDSIVLVKGARQVGKTSLLARGLQQAREAGARVVVTDFQLLSESHLVSAEALLQVLGGWIAEQLDLDASMGWNSGDGPGLSFRRFMRREVLARVGTRLVWGLDEVDRLFSCTFASEVFGLFRSWHNERALDPAGPWSHLTLAIAYATEAHLFITDLNQSPFNVGTRLNLEDFSFEQVADLNERYGCPLRDSDSVRDYYRLVGGHPYLVRRGLHEMVSRGLGGGRQRPIDALELHADREEGVFGDHLRRLLAALAGDPGLCETLRAILQDDACPTSESFLRLRSAGVLSGESADEARFRCEVYARFLHRHLAR
jgi:DNA-binding SARP family transcriptional activator